MLVVLQFIEVSEDFRDLPTGDSGDKPSEVILVLNGEWIGEVRKLATLEQPGK